MIVATAGHVDHGKTLLIKRLTGIDTDRLPEEKARGLSIDLGFAYVPLPNGDILGFVDVPGHERFIRNMACGVAAVDFALLVVAADDGVMPQTTEHLAILDLLGVAQGAVAISKIDRVEPGRVDVVAAGVAELLADTGLAGAPAFPVSGITGEGIEALKVFLQQAAESVAAGTAGGNFRLAIDRDFTVPGAGLVVTGAVFSGTAAVDDRLILSPQGIEVRIRGIHAQNRQSPTARAGQRAAINIAGPGLRNAEIHRGDWLVAEPAHAPAQRIDARLRVLEGEARPLGHWTPVHLHLAAADVTARVAVLGAKKIEPGDAGLVQLVLDRPIGALRGDRFILRDQSARRTIAGGAVIDIFPPARGRARPERLAQLTAMQQPTPAAALGDLVAAAPAGVPLVPFATAWNLTPAEAAAVYEQVPMVTIGAREAPVAVAPARWQALRDDILGTVAAFHAKSPEAVGPEQTALRRSLPATAPAPLFAAALDKLIAERAVMREGLSLHLPSHRARLSDAEEALWQRVETLLAEGELKPPRVREVAEALGKTPETVERFFQRAAKLGLLLPVAPNRYFPPAPVRRLAAIAEQLAEQGGGEFDAKAYRDASGIGRNLTIELLEFFDKAGFTRRIGDSRRIAKPAAEAFGGGD